MAASHIDRRSAKRSTNRRNQKQNFSGSGCGWLVCIGRRNKMSNRYRITIETLGSRTSQGEDEASLQFCTDNHDNLLEIVEAIRSKRLLDKDKSASLAIGLKLFSEIIREMRKDQMFAPLVLPIRNFIEQLKRIKVGDRPSKS
jgi:Domain of Unknown Function with PDB structure (DUF3861)